jgi:hypothetical protein
MITNKGEERHGRRLRGQDEYGTLFEWYGESGGQLKYYPRVENALWKSEVFVLQPLPKKLEGKAWHFNKSKRLFS